MSEQTPKKRPAKPFKGKEDGKPFSKENQPSPELKKIGWSKKRALKDLLLLKPGKINGQTNYVEACSNFFGIKPESVTVKMIMDFRQAEKAILKGDTSAYIAVNDRAFGKPIQAITGEGGKPIQMQTIPLTKEEIDALSKKFDDKY